LHHHEHHHASRRLFVAVADDVAEVLTLTPAASGSAGLSHAAVNEMK
jgi:hypothetical protein